MAEESVRLANDAVKAALEDVEQWRAEVNEITQELKVWKKSNPGYLHDEGLKTYYDDKKQDLDKASERLDKASERLKDASERLKDERAYYLQVVNLDRGDTQRQETVLWLVNGSVENALVTKGVRSRVYQLADTHLGFYIRNHDGVEEDALWYEGKTLRIHIAFERKEHALYFQSQFQREYNTVGSPLRGAVIMSRVSLATGLSTDLRRIFSGDYNPADTESPQETNTSIASSLSVCGPTNDLFKYQRIEDAKVFGTVGNAHKAHLISHEHCNLYPDTYGKEYDEDENNRLALSPELHAFYDAVIPAINIRAVSSAPFQQGAENRFKVEIEVSVLDNSYKHLLNRLKEGSTLTADPLIMRTTVEVKNPRMFCKCLEWKFKKNRAAWQEYFSMDSAVE